MPIRGPLDGAEAKLQRAQHHLKAFHSEWQWVFQTDPVRPALKRDEQTGDYIVWVQYIPEMPPHLGAVLGDILHNMRSCLNFIAYELVRAAGTLTTKNEESIQFPILDDPPRAPKTFADVVRKTLPGIDSKALALIERFQPYNRPDLGRLGRLSNQDKHWIPVLILSRTMATTPTFRVPGCSVEVQPINIYEPLNVGAEVARLRIYGCVGSVGDEAHVQMKGNFIPEITFEDGREVVVTLMGLGGTCAILAHGLMGFVEPQPFPFIRGKSEVRQWPSFSTLP